MPELIPKIVLKMTDNLMRDVNTIKSEITVLQNQIEELKKRLKGDFNKDLQDLLDKHKESIDSIRIGINNHEFNDGEPTYFSLYYDDLTVVYSDEFGDECEQTSYDEGGGNPKIELIRQEFVKLFSEYDVEGFYDSMFGDEYEELTFNVKR